MLSGRELARERSRFVATLGRRRKRSSSESSKKAGSTRILDSGMEMTVEQVKKFVRAFGRALRDELMKNY